MSNNLKIAVSYGLFLGFMFGLYAAVLDGAAMLIGFGFGIAFMTVIKMLENGVAMEESGRKIAELNRRIEMLNSLKAGEGEVNERLS